MVNKDPCSQEGLSPLVHSLKWIVATGPTWGCPWRRPRNFDGSQMQQARLLARVLFRIHMQLLFLKQLHWLLVSFRKPLNCPRKNGTSWVSPPWERGGHIALMRFWDTISPRKKLFWGGHNVVWYPKTHIWPPFWDHDHVTATVVRHQKIASYPASQWRVWNESLNTLRNLDPKDLASFPIGY